MRSRSSHPGSHILPCRCVTRLVVVLALGLFALHGCRFTSTSAAVPASIQPRFSDVTTTAGVDWRHENGARGRLLYPELVGGGGGLVELDGDGRLDVVLINSGALPGTGAARGGHAVYLNRGDGTFRDTAGESGLNGPAYGMGVAAGDYDADGLVDLYITGVHESRLYHNEGAGRFKDVTPPPLKNAGHWGTSASWADFNSDGRLDLFVGNYVKWSAAKDVPCQMRGMRTYCGPNSYAPDHCVLLRNDGGGRFTDVTRAAGLDSMPAKALGVVILDVDNDRRLDFLVACDLKPNLLLRNRGDGSFEDVAVERGVAVSEQGLPRAGMGIDAWEEEPGRWSVWIGHLTGEGAGYYRQSEAGGGFADVATAMGLHGPTLKVLTFGLVAQDFDRDGRVDLALGNGHVDMLAERTRDQPVKQPALLFQGGADGSFADVTAGAGEPFQGRYLGRALAWGDIDNDGDQDLLLVENGGPARLWRNDTPSRNHWIGLDCRSGHQGSPAIGARVELDAGGRTQVRWVRGDGSYLSASDTRVVFGLGAAGKVDRIRIRWPDGRTEELPGPAPDRYWRVRPGAAPEAVQ